MKTKPITDDVHVRWMIKRDMEEVLDLEQIVFEYPWSEKDFSLTLRNPRVIGMVAEHLKHGWVMGYVVYCLHRRSLELLNFAVAPRFQRKHVGTRIIDHLKRKLSITKRNRIEVVVRERNLDALLFFRALGFLATDTLRNYYEETPEDGIVMEYRL